MRTSSPSYVRTRHPTIYVRRSRTCGDSETRVKQHMTACLWEGKVNRQAYEGLNLVFFFFFVCVCTYFTSTWHMRTDGFERSAFWWAWSLAVDLLAKMDGGDRPNCFVFELISIIMGWDGQVKKMRVRVGKYMQSIIKVHQLCVVELTSMLIIRRYIRLRGAKFLIATRFFR